MDTSQMWSLLPPLPTWSRTERLMGCLCSWWKPEHLFFAVTAVTASVVVFLLKMVSHGRSNKSRKPNGSKNIPSGPRGLPIIGNAHQLGKDPHKTLYDLSQKYGDVFLIKLGSHPVVVLSRASAIKQALISQTIAFAGRPSFLGFSTVLSVRGGGISVFPYDEGWKMHRELVDKAFNDFSAGDQVKMLESHVTTEVSGFLNFLLKDKTSVNCEPKKLLQMVIVNVMTNLLFNVRRELDHPELQKLIDGNKQGGEASGSANIVNFLPFLKHLLFGKLRKVEETTRAVMKLLDVYAEESITTYTPGSKENIFHYLRTLVTDFEERTVERLGLTETRIRADVYDLFGAGYETVSSALMWPFVYLVNFPDLQKEIQDEIDYVVGRDRLPSLADREKLPSMEAFIAEVFRHVSVVPLVIPHKTIEDTVLGAGYDYFIPKDTIVFMNLYSIHRDPKQWTSPEVFNPKRFLLDSGGGIDKKKVTSVLHLGGGIRRCVGIDVTPIILVLFLSNLLHQCSLKRVDVQRLSMEGITTPVTVKPPDYRIKIERR